MTYISELFSQNPAAMTPEQRKTYRNALWAVFYNETARYTPETETKAKALLEKVEAAYPSEFARQSDEEYLATASEEDKEFMRSVGIDV